MNIKTQLISAVILLFLMSCNNGKDMEVNLELTNKIDSLQVQNDSLREVLVLKSEEIEGSEIPQWYYPETDARKLSNIEDPEEYIKSALREKTDLIPMDAVLGGTMHFNNIQLLGSNWLIADFEDGHVYGKALFEYAVREKNEINFKIVALNKN